MSAFGASLLAATAANDSAGKRRTTPPTYGVSGRTAAEVLRAAVASAGGAGGAGGAAVAGPAGAGGARRSRASSAEEILGDRLLPPPADGGASVHHPSSISAPQSARQPAGAAGGVGGAAKPSAARERLAGAQQRDARLSSAVWASKGPPAARAPDRVG